MIKRMHFKDLGMDGEILPIYLYVENNLEKYQPRYPELLSDKHLKMAAERFGTKKENLALVELSYNDERGMRTDISQRWDFRESRKSDEVDEYKLIQKDAILIDGASTPVTIGDIRGFGPNVRRAYWVHDIVYAIFHQIDRKMADRWFTCFLEKDGTNLPARMVMHAALRMFGRNARKLDPKEHWNYGRVELYKNGERIG